MTAREWTKVSPALWESARFQKLADSDARLLHLFYVCGPHANSSGCSRIREGYALSDLGWTADRYRKAQKALTVAEMVEIDHDSEEVFVLRWFKHNPPMNKDHAKGAKKLIEKIDSDKLREMAEAEFMATEWGARSVPPKPSDNPLDTPYSPLAVSRGLLESAAVRGYSTSRT